MSERDGMNSGALQPPNNSFDVMIALTVVVSSLFRCSVLISANWEKIRLAVALLCGSARSGPINKDMFGNINSSIPFFNSNIARQNSSSSISQFTTSWFKNSRHSHSCVAAPASGTRLGNNRISGIRLSPNFFGVQALNSYEGDVIKRYTMCYLFTQLYVVCSARLFYFTNIGSC